MRRQKLALSILFAICLFLFAVFAVFSFVVVDGSSMAPSLEDGQLVVVNRLAFGLRLGPSYLLSWARPARGDILLFEPPSLPGTVIKRALGLEGDMLVVSPQGLEVCGAIFPLDSAQRFHLMNAGPLPPATVFLVGDNPLHSLDSRDYGPVPIENIVGKVLGSFLERP